MSLLMKTSMRILHTLRTTTLRASTMEYCSNWAVQSIIYAGRETFIIETAKQSDVSRIADFLTSVFTFTEPHCRALGMTPDEAKPFITAMAEKCIPHGLSCLVTEDRSKELAAVRLFGVAGREDDSEEAIELSPKMRIISNLLELTKEGFWEMVDGNVRRVVTREITSVKQQHMRKGIATFLLSYLLDEHNIRRLDVQGIISEASSIENQRLLRKAGYEVYKEVKHVNYVDRNGHRIFNCDDGTDRIILFFKKF
uniref:aralkylamine N-acetyltransferase n=1 Tax=Parascaris univalens TaxID=6257 RepID=A0A915B0A0_PARUN